MTYASGGLIQATDYNNIVGGNPTDVAGTINRVWAIGQNDRGYGQTAISQVSAGNTVTAAQWASLINNLNNAYRHNTSTAGTGLSAPTAGTLILFISTLTGYVTTIHTNRLSATTTGTTTSSSSSASFSAAGNVAGSTTISRTVTFSSGIDATRYFWNAGGSITFDVTSVTNNDGTARSGSIVTLANTNFNAKTVRAQSAGARTGTGGVVSTDTTNSGFYSFTGSFVAWCLILGQTYPYTADYVQLSFNSSGGAGSYGGNGNVINVQFVAFSGTTGTASPTLDAMNVTINYTLTVTYPSTTYLSDSWGTATIT